MHQIGPALLIGSASEACNNEAIKRKHFKQEDITMKTYTMNNEKKAIKELNPNDLNEISGGFLAEIVNDSAHLKDLGLLPDTVGDIYTLFNWDDATSFVEGGWAKVGITCVTCFDSCNKYYYQGKRIRRDDALEIAKKACIKGPQIGPRV